MKPAPDFIRALRRTVLLALVAGAVPPSATAAAFQVGGGATCYSPDVQTALDAAGASAGPDTVAITVNAQLTGLAVSIDAHDVIVSGDWDDCSLLSRDERSMLDGSGSRWIRRDCAVNLPSAA